MGPSFAFLSNHAYFDVWPVIMSFSSLQDAFIFDHEVLHSDGPLAPIRHLESTCLRSSGAGRRATGSRS
jgi:hypothetical protein